jgi:hypothetical protein
MPGLEWVAIPVSLAYGLDDIDLHVWIRRSQLEEPGLLRVCFVVRLDRRGSRDGP